MEIFWRIFDNVSKWLDFAEKKNSGLTTILGFGTILGIILQITGKIEIPLNWLLIVPLFFFILTWIITVVSFLPRTKIDAVLLLSNKRTTERKDSDNLLFFGDILKYSQDNFFGVIAKKYSLKITRQQKKLALDLCSQILQNAAIAKRKYTCFRNAIITLFMGVGSLTVWIVLFYILKIAV
jgi:hypothetical protein